MNTTSGLAHSVNVFLSDYMLDRATPLLLHESFAQMRELPLKSTSTMRFRKYGALTANTTALSEGITPAGSSLSKSNVDISIYQYGDYVTLSDYLQDTSPDEVMIEAAEVLGEQAGQSLDLIVRDNMHIGTNVIYADATSPAANTARTDIVAADVIDTDAVQLAITTLKVANAMKLKGFVSANEGYNTTPVRPCFVAIVHPYTTPTLEAFSAWKPVEEYADSTELMPGEIGAWKDVRFVETTHAKVFTGGGSGGIDVYSTLVLGMNAVGVSKLAGKGLEYIVKGLGSGGTEDPLNQRSTAGWKATRGAGILQQLFMVRVEHAVA
jgi:N4-gp56 family major capsid protein